MKNKKINNPHDKFVREIMEHIEAAQDFFQVYLPPNISDQLDYNTLEILKDSFIDEYSAL